MNNKYVNLLPKRVTDWLLSKQEKKKVDNDEETPEQWWIQFWASHENIKEKYKLRRSHLLDEDQVKITEEWFIQAAKEHMEASIKFYNEIKDYNE